MKKRIKLPQLHYQILIALVLGAIFGSIFKVHENKLIVTRQIDNQIIESEIYKWEKIFLLTENDTSEYAANAQLQIINDFKRLSKKENVDVIAINFSEEERGIILREKRFDSVETLNSEKSIASNIKWIGDIFIRLLNMIAIPLVLASLIVGAASLGDIRRVAKIGGKTISIYLITTAFAITIGVVTANLIQPGKKMDPNTKDRLVSVYQEDVSEKIESEIGIDLIQQIVEIVPKNPFDAMAKSNMLQIVFFAIMTGIVLTMIPGEKGNVVITFFDGISDIMIKMVDLIMVIAPYGVFALIAAVVSEFGFEILGTLIWYVICVVLGLFIQTAFVYPMIIKMFSKLKISTFFKAMRQVHTIAFSTSSSAATLPVNIEVNERDLGVSNKITSFVLPLGATINMDGTALYQGVAAIFIAQVYGFDLNLGQQLTVILTATLASIGTAPIPGVGIIMLIIVLKSIGVPEEGIALILGIDRVLDMLRTVTNVTGDAAVNVAVASTENEISYQ